MRLDTKTGFIIPRKRSNKELLELLLEKSKIWIGKETKKECTGLCNVIECLWCDELITDRENEVLHDIIALAPHPLYELNCLYYWKPFDKDSRIFWLETLIKKY